MSSDPKRKEIHKLNLVQLAYFRNQSSGNSSVYAEGLKFFVAFTLMFFIASLLAENEKQPKD